MAPPSANGGGSKFYSPLVLNIAGKEGIGMAELENISGTGAEGRVTKKDILNYVATRGQGGAVPGQQGAVSNQQSAVSSQPVQQTVSAPAPQPASSPAPQGNVEIIEMDRMRKLIADHMVRSVATSPHVTSFTECDVTNIVKWRDKNKGPFEKKYGEKITFTPIFIEAIVACIRRYPMINASVDGDKIIIKKDINIGMAAALPSGNLIVPVIKNSDTKNLLGLTKDVNALANAARNNKLKADDTQGGTFTLTNVGTFGSLMGTPIINQPQVAILAVGAIKKRPMVLETEDGDVIAIRHMMYLSLSYDHRIVDGSLGASFLTAVANELEAFDTGRAV
jgi:2-oxoglutarate dehydrogenase E2 component (dihydrolipoamide succinyltransferase)